MRRAIHEPTTVDPAKIFLLAPAVFLVHVAEEAPNFVGWFNSLVGRGISQELFLRVNVAAFLITAVVVGVAIATRAGGAAWVGVAWLSFLMLANAIFHIVGTLVHSRYSPGVMTAAVLYLPYFGWVLRAVQRRFPLHPAVVVIVVLAAGLPMFAHGYLIVFEGGRLF